MSDALERIGEQSGDSPSRDLVVWADSLTRAGGAIGLRDNLTIVETESGLTAAVRRPYDLKIGRGDIARTRGSSLIVLSVLRGYGPAGPAVVFEEHSSQWDEPYQGQPIRFDVCRTPCTRRVISSDRVIDYPYDNAHGIDSFDEPSLVEPNDLIKAYMRRVRQANASQDVFRGGEAMDGALEVLERHELLSPAAREAFGLPGMRAIEPGS